MYICYFVVVFLGTGIHFGGITFFLFWLFHCGHLFFSLAFPFKANHISKSFSLKLKIHIAEVTFILLCGLLPSIVIISTSKYQYNGFPLFCFSSSHLVFFYSYVLPIAIGAVIGICLLFASFWIVHKVGSANHEPCSLTKHAVRGQFV